MVHQTAFTICRGLSNPTRSLSRIVCRGQEPPKGNKGTLRPVFRANTRPKVFLKPMSPQDTGRPGLLEERGMDESRHGSKARPWHRRDFFFWFKLEPRTRWGISNFAKTRTRSRRVVFQNQTGTLDRFRGIYTPCSGHPPPNYSCKWGILDFWTHMVTHLEPKFEEGGHPPPPLPPILSCAHIFECLWGPGIDSKE